MAVNSEANLHTIVICANLFVRKDGKYLVIKRSPLKADLPNYLHAIGGKVSSGEDPMAAAERELEEEAGIKAKNVRLEAVVTEVLSPEDSHYKSNWLIFFFSGDYDSGEVIHTDEGELLWLSSAEIVDGKLFPSLQAIIDDVLNPEVGTVFARFVYDKDRNIIEKQLHSCAR